MRSLKLILRTIKEIISSVLHDSFYRIVTYLFYLISRTFFQIQIYGQEKPLLWRKKNNSAFLVVARHRSYWDPVFLPVAFGSSPYTRLKCAARENLKLLFQFIPFLNSHVIYINRENVGRDTIEKIIKSVEEKNNLAIFPEGTTIPEDKKLRGGVILIIKRAEKITGQKIPIFPLNIKVKGAYGKPQGKWWRYLIRQVKIELRIGDPIFIQQLEKTIAKKKISKGQKRKLMIKELLRRVDQI